LRPVLKVEVSIPLVEVHGVQMRKGIDGRTSGSKGSSLGCGTSSTCAFFPVPNLMGLRRVEPLETNDCAVFAVEGLDHDESLRYISSLGGTGGGMLSRCDELKSSEKRETGYLGIVTVLVLLLRLLVRSAAFSIVKAGAGTAGSLSNYRS
jgi:hypothetical protein